MRLVQAFQHQYINNKKDTSNDSCQKIMNAIRLYYTEKEQKDDSCFADEEDMHFLIKGLNVSDAPAFVVKAVSEIYNKDFWDLWAQVKDVVYRKLNNVYGNEDYYVAPLSTEEFFKLAPDDMIPYWENDDKIIFSEELWDWFESLKQEYDIMVNENKEVKNLLKYMIDLLVEADENYYNIFVFNNFFEECLENLNDIRYQVLWRMFDKMIHDPELMKAGDVIFVPEGQEHENEGLHYWGEQPKRRLKGNWDFIHPSEQNNKGRMTLRRYMALVGNELLRKEIFGF